MAVLISLSAFLVLGLTVWFLEWSVEDARRRIDRLEDRVSWREVL